MRSHYNRMMPEIIEKSGRKAYVRVLIDEEYYKALIEKLSKEVEEFSESGTIEEIAYFVEVIYALLYVKGVSLEQARKT